MEVGRGLEDFASFVGRALGDLKHELCQAYQRASAEQLEEQRRLQGEVARLSAELQEAARDQPTRSLALVQEAEPLDFSVDQPPAAAQIEPFLRSSPRGEKAPRASRRPASPEPPSLEPASPEPASPEPVVLDVQNSPSSKSAKSPRTSRAKATPGSPKAARQLSAFLNGSSGEMTPRTPKTPSFITGFPSWRAGETVAQDSGELQVVPPLNPWLLLMTGGMRDEKSVKSAATLDRIRSKSRSRCDSDDRDSAVSSLQSGWSSQVMARRVQARLGPLQSRGLIKGRDLHQVLCALGLEKYTVKDMNNLVHHLTVAINLTFREGGSMGSFPSCSSVQHVQTDLVELAGRAEWQWPNVWDEGSVSRKSGIRHMAHGYGFGSALSTSTLNLEESPDSADRAIPWKALIELFSKEESYLERLLGHAYTDQIFAIREVVLTGEANRIISELTFVKIDDLATSRRRRDELNIMDTVVGIVIFLNGIAVGLQADRSFRDWEWWIYVEVAFTAFFLCEILARLFREGCRTYLCGPERRWHLLDIVLVCLGGMECLWDFAGNGVHQPSGLVRWVRLIRLLRVARIFRLRFMLELRLMVKGLFSGMRTLFWAFVLLLFVLYAFGVATTMFLGDSHDSVVQELFANVPAAMFTTFRCASGDCFTTGGTSLTSILFFQYGPPFAVVFVITYMMITLGLFNVILAIYVDVTMVAAKQTDDANKGRHEQECIRVAQLTKKLLKMFCAAHQFQTRLAPSERQRISMNTVLLAADTNDIEIDDDIAISKDLYLLITQEPAVRKLMDELDIPPDRAALFECFDADGSGRLQATELVRGFLKVRGGVKKADHVASILALRSIQITLKQMGDDLQDQKRMLMEHVNEAHKSSRV